MRVLFFDNYPLMKKLFITAVAALFMLAGTQSAQAQSIKDILGNIATSAGGDSSSDGSGLGGLLGGLASGLLSDDNVDPAKMTGHWKYSEPAVCFKSDNFLQKAGGAAAAQTVQDKLAPYYKIAGMDQMTLDIADDQTFNMNVRKAKLKGTVTKDENGDIFFEFKAMGKVKLSKMQVYVTMTGSNSMSLMFDVTKLVSIIKAAGSVTGNATIKGASALLESYDGICAGFKMAKQK